MPYLDNNHGLFLHLEVMSDGQKNVYGRSLAPCCYDPMTGLQSLTLVQIRKDLHIIIKYMFDLYLTFRRMNYNYLGRFFLYTY